MADAGLFNGIEGTADRGGSADDEGAGRDDHALGDEGIGADDGAGADLRAIEDGGAHADEDLVIDGAGVEDGGVAAGDVLADVDAEVIREMDHAGVLDIRAWADADFVEIRPDDGAIPDAGILADGDMADDDGAGGDECGGMDRGRGVEEASHLRIEGHGMKVAEGKARRNRGK